MGPRASAPRAERRVLYDLHDKFSGPHIPLRRSSSRWALRLSSGEVCFQGIAALKAGAGLAATAITSVQCSQSAAAARRTAAATTGCKASTAGSRPSWPASASTQSDMAPADSSLWRNELLAPLAAFWCTNRRPGFCSELFRCTIGGHATLCLCGASGSSTACELGRNKRLGRLVGVSQARLCPACFWLCSEQTSLYVQTPW